MEDLLQNHDYDTIKTQLNQVNRKGMNYLHLTAKEGNIVVVQWLLDHIAPVKCQRMFWYRGQIVNYSAILINDTDKKKKTPLDYAIAGGHLSVVTSLVNCQYLADRHRYIQPLLQNPRFDNVVMTVVASMIRVPSVTVPNRPIGHIILFLKSANGLHYAFQTGHYELIKTYARKFYLDYKDTLTATEKQYVDQLLQARQTFNNETPPNPVLECLSKDDHATYRVMVEAKQQRYLDGALSHYLRKVGNRNQIIQLLQDGADPIPCLVPAIRWSLYYTKKNCYRITVRHVFNHKTCQYDEYELPEGCIYYLDNLYQSYHKNVRKLSNRICRNCEDIRTQLWEYIRTLLEHGAYVGQEGVMESLLECAPKYCKLIMKSPDFDPNVGYLLHTAIEHHDLDMIQKLIKIGVDCNRDRDGVRPLHQAIMSDDKGIFSILIRAGANPSLKSVYRNYMCTPLRMSLLQNNDSWIRFQLPYTPDCVIWKACQKNVTNKWKKHCMEVVLGTRMAIALVNHRKRYRLTRYLIQDIVALL